MNKKFKQIINMIAGDNAEDKIPTSQVKSLIRDIVSLWEDTQRGHIDKCRKKQLIFSDVMLDLHDKFRWEEYNEYHDKEEWEDAVGID